MPNHVTNRLQIISDEISVDKVRRFLRSKTNPEDHIDFNNIIPMPEKLKITSSSTGRMVHFLLFGYQEEPIFIAYHHPVEAENFKTWNSEMRSEGIALALQYQFNLENYGHTTWYGWCRENWGTKWNAYDQDQETKEFTSDTIIFRTAWNSPTELIKTLSTKFPAVKFKFDYADEDSGCNVGNLVFQNGNILHSFFPEKVTKEAYDIYFDLHPDSRKYYDLVDGNYVYNEDYED